MTPLSRTHAGALQLAARGCAVFPCQPRGKAPATGRGVLDATTDFQRIDAWWRSAPDLNIGLATGSVSGFFVLDIDDAEGHASLHRLEAEHGELPPTVEVITGRGRHCYFRLGDGPVRNSTGQIGTGLDIRGDGGYVLAPPSLHPSGATYAWSVDTADSFADAPEWLHEFLSASDAKKAGKPIEHWHATLTRAIANGERNVTLTSIAGKMVHAGVDAILAYDLLTCVNLARCTEPLPAEDIETIVLSVSRAHLKKLRGHV
jgi:hypothetical protein